MTKMCVVNKVFAGFYFDRLFLYRLNFLPTLIDADIFTDKVRIMLAPTCSLVPKSSFFPLAFFIAETGFNRLFGEARVGHMAHFCHVSVLLLE